LNKRGLLAILVAVIIAAGIGGFAALQMLTQPVQKPSQPESQKSEIPGSGEVKVVPKVTEVTIRAFDQEGKELTAEVKIYRNGELINFGKTPWKLILYCGNYKFLFEYENQTIEKTVEINKEKQEIVVTFKIEFPIAAELTTDELAIKLHLVDDVAAENISKVEELIKWLVSLEGKYVRLTGKVTYIGEWDGCTLFFGSKEGETTTTSGIGIFVRGNPSLILEKEKIKVGDIITFDVKVERMPIYFYGAIDKNQPSNYYKITVTEESGKPVGRAQGYISLEKIKEGKVGRAWICVFNEDLKLEFIRLNKKY
jgi:hypothetical protein